MAHARVGGAQGSPRLPITTGVEARFLRRAALVAALLLQAVAVAPVASAATGDISTFAGNGTDSHSGDSGLATSAAMRDPLGVAVAPSGDRYIVDYGSHRVRKVTAAGVISTFAGTGSSGFSGNEAGDQRAAGPAGRRGDRRGRQRLHRRLRQLAGPQGAPGGIISTYAGTWDSGYSGDGGPPPRPGSRRRLASTSTAAATSTSPTSTTPSGA